MSIQRSGQIVVAAAGTAVRGPASPRGRRFLLAAHPDNTKPMWVGDDGDDDVAADTGFPLRPGESVEVVVAALDGLLVDAEVNGESVCWLVLE